MTDDLVQSIALVSLGLFTTSLIYEIFIFRAKLKIEKEKLAELRMIKETLSVWGRAMLDLKVKSVKDEQRGNNGKENGKENISQSIHAQGLSKRNC